MAVVSLITTKEALQKELDRLEAITTGGPITVQQRKTRISRLKTRLARKGVVPTEEPVVEPTPPIAPEVPITPPPGPIVTKEDITKLLEAGELTEEQIESQQEIFRTELGREREKALTEVKSAFAGKGTGRIRTELLEEERATAVRFGEARTKGELEIELTSKQRSFENQIKALNLSLNRDQLASQTWAMLNTVEQQQWESDFKQKALDLGYATELAKIQADADASGKTLGEYVLSAGAGAATGAVIGGIPGAIIGAGVGLFAELFS